MDHDAALEYSQSLAQIGDGWWRQLVWATRQGIPNAMGMTVDEWRSAYYGHLHLPVVERREAVAELSAEGMTQREIGDVLGVSRSQVNRDLVPFGTTDEPVTERPDRALVPDGTTDEQEEDATGSDPEPWVVLEDALRSVGSLAKSYDAARIAAAVPARRRAATAKRLRGIGTDLGRVALALERLEQST